MIQVRKIWRKIEIIYVYFLTCFWGGGQGKAGKGDGGHHLHVAHNWRHGTPARYLYIEHIALHDFYTKSIDVIV